MFVEDTDFDAIPYNIPNSVDAPNALDDLIPFAERQLLRQILGSSTYNEFINAVFVDPDANPPEYKPDEEIPQKWLDLRDGADYVLSDSPDAVSYRYDGIVGIIKPYICAEWWDKNASNISEHGESEPIVENGVIISPAKKISDYWNEADKLIGQDGCDEDTLYGFMQSRYEEDFPNWRFESLGDKNEWDF